MKKCPSCGYENPANDMRCPKCGSYYSKIIELIDKEAAEEEKNTWRERYRRMVASGNIKQAIASELTQMISILPMKTKFTLFVIFVFVFALVFAV